MLHTVLTATQTYLAVPPVSPTAPPGSKQLLLILGWVLWIATLACVAAVVFAGIKIALASGGRGGGGEHGMTLLMALGGTVVCGVAAAVVTLLA